ncbi:MAG: hypothetical protein FWH07_01470 [Oscillospiraceae bacterium]|nr:hypothetical protein [Oscillospiraceae bacterium]
MSVPEFLNALKQEQLTGREFLAIIGHTDISNKDYSEIKENPLMSYSRLVEILENSPITGNDYENLLKTARDRREKRNQKKKRAELETRLTSILAGETVKPQNEEKLSHETKAELFATDEISLDRGIDDDSAYNGTSVEELWDEAGVSDNGDGSPDYDDSDEYGERGDFDQSARSENLPKIIICLSLGFILALSSFLIPYMTGKQGIPGFGGRVPQSYEEIYTLQSGKSSRGENIDETAIWRAEKFTEPLNALSVITASNRYLFKITDKSVHAVEIDSGIMSDAPAFTPYPVYDSRDSSAWEIIGMFEQNDRLYVICTDLHKVIIENKSENEDEVIDERVAIFNVPQTLIYEFDALEFTGIPDEEYRIDGGFKEVVLHEGGFFVIADYTPLKNDDEYTYYIPTYNIGNDNAERSLAELENIEFIGNAPYSDMSVIASVSRDNFTLYAVSGNTADSVRYSHDEIGGSLIIGFYSEKKNESRLLRYSVFGSVLSNPAWGSVSGIVNRGFIDERAGVIRVVADLGNTAVLHLFDTGMSALSRSGSVTTDGTTAGAAFDNDTAYIIAHHPAKAYAIDTTNSAKPAFLNDVDTLISDKEFYRWGNNRFFTVGIDIDEEGNRQGVMVTMYVNESGASKTEQVYRLSLNDAVWHDYTNTSAEMFREAVAASRESGIIIIPVTYFNSVTRVESFFALNYIEDSNGGEFAEVGKITEIGFNTRFHAVVIRGGYIYTFWDNAVRSAATDLTMIGIHQLS